MYDGVDCESCGMTGSLVLLHCGKKNHNVETGGFVSVNTIPHFENMYILVFGLAQGQTSAF